MNTIELWKEIIPKPEPPASNMIYSCCFSTDGTLLFVVISEILVVYTADKGEAVIKPTKAAKQPINCIAFARDNKTFAMASMDRSCVVWRFNMESEKKIEPLIRVTQGDAIFTLSFNPLTQELFSGGGVDFVIIAQNKKEIPKEKTPEKIMCSGWSADGQTLAYGTINGTISLRARNLEEKNQIKLESAVWCMEWSPITHEHEESFLLAGCWDQTLYYFNSEGEKRERFSQRHLQCNPISINFHSSGQYFLMSGTNKKVSLYSRDLGYLADVADLNDWSWSSRFRPKSQSLVITTNAGLISMQQISKKFISSHQHELYARRDNFTDVVVENILLNQKMRLKCKELVRKISIFKDKLAVLQSERLLIYISSEQALKYSPYRKITRRFECDFMEILNSHVLFAMGSKIQAYNFLGELEREWVVDGNITCIQTVGGPPKREHALVGSSNGQVLKLFVDNSFPIQLYRSPVSIVSCSLNVSKKKLAVLDLNSNLIGYDLLSMGQLFQETNVGSYAWNSDLEDFIAFSSGGSISIRIGALAPLVQKSDALIIGFEGFQLLVSKNEAVSAMDISQSTTLVKFVERKEYQMAYKLACLGVPDNDLRFLGLQALQNLDFQVAEKCFVRLKDLQLADLTRKYLEEYKKDSKMNPQIMKGQLLAYQGKYQEAASLMTKNGRNDDAVGLFCDLKKFEQAQRYIKMNGMKNSKDMTNTLYLEQAEWVLLNGDWKQAAQLYLTAKQYKKAIDLYNRENHLDGLIEVCRVLDRESSEGLLLQCADTFKKQKHHAYAKEVYLKLNDMKALIDLHVQMEKWDDAFLLAKQNTHLLDAVKLPYANYLLRNDDYDGALRAFKKINRPDLTHKIVTQFSRNAVNERRFKDASRQYWALAIEELKVMRVRGDPHDIKYRQLKDTAEIYYVYSSIVQFVETPFFTSSDSALYTILNACRYLISRPYKLMNVNASYIYYSLAKITSRLEGYKTARACYDKLAQLVVPSKWVDEMELGSLLIRAKPFSDRDDILPTCSRCHMANPLISDKQGCFNCKHPFIVSFMSFEILPLVQFKTNLPHSQVIQLINSEKKQQKKGDGWKQTINNNQQILKQADKERESVVQRLLREKMTENIEAQSLQTEYLPLTLNEQEIAQLDNEAVYVVDQRKINNLIPVKYYINMANEILLKCCLECGQFFLLDEYEFEFVHTKRCPYCGGEEKRSDRPKDIFDL